MNAYDDYGIPAAANAGRFQYTGQAWLPEIGMYNYKARIYSPTLGRFLQTDPIGYGDGMNMYAYVGGDPVNRSDPSGLCTQLTWHHLVWTDGVFNSGKSFSMPVGISCTTSTLGQDSIGALGRFGGPKLTNFNASLLINDAAGDSPTLPCSAANQAGEGVRVTLGFTNTPVPGTSHAFVVITDPTTKDRFASRAGPWSGPGGGSTGNITAVSGAYGPSFPDYGATTGSLGVGNLNVSFEQAALYMNSFAQTTNNNNLTYGYVVQNSNSYASAMLKGMGFTPPATGRVTPGYNSNPVDPSMACH